jgi:hypothetical protein
MKTQGVLLALVIALASCCAGYWLGRHSAATADAAKPVAASDRSAGKLAPLPPVKSKRIAASPDDPEMAGDQNQKLALAAIEALIRAESKPYNRRRYLEFELLLNSIRPENMPQVLAIVEKACPKNQLNGMRSNLLSLWAESDPTAAMAYASAIGDVNLRYSEINTVLRGWAEKNVGAATAWAQ